MNRTTQFRFRIALIVVLASTILLMATPMVWAGPGSQTVPIATAIGPGSVILDLMRWSVHAAGKNCTNGCALALADLGTLKPPPDKVTFESAVQFSGTPKGFLPATVRVCYQTTDKRDRIYYFDVQLNRWVPLRVTTRSSSQVCTNVRFGNVFFAAGR